ncbi:MFS transporter [Chitinasiproducens palmae]|uniref:MFS transporter, MHS family, proline/betaine transporter n=1 Tax=Chitinasiproducens palmae TaxID=1770053 RepID=A0A1H2PN62_9BURK|nr:MFS transporter [Chitinasiproducens palmae]SDV48067.1 MFS transporter, MHS family, proline/betaine transporter [Chitinasiproducens palmae]
MRTVATQAAAAADSISPGTRRHAVVATLIGNALEWFDFTVYSFFAVVIARKFFPSGSELTSLLLAVATFGVGFFMRPVGGIVLGIYGDKAGRKAALSLTVLLMALGTAMIGLAPTYETIGLGAPMIIVVARLLQGFSAGGEMGGATAFLTEYAPAGKRTFYSSWIQASIGLAVVLGALTGSIVTNMLSPAALDSWGWRVPFLLGIVIGPIGFYIRNRVDETPAFKQAEKVKSPLAEIARRYPRQTFASFAMVILWTVCTYVLLFYTPTYAVKVLKMSASDGFAAGIVGGAALTICSPIIGALADRLGRKVFLSGAAIVIFATAYPMFAYINAHPSGGALMLFQLYFGVLIAAYTGPILAAFATLFPSNVLSTGLSVAYNLAVTLFGGFAPFFMTWLIASTGNTLAPSFYLMFAAAVSFLGTLAIKTSKD